MSAPRARAGRALLLFASRAEAAAASTSASRPSAEAAIWRGSSSFCSAAAAEGTTKTTTLLSPPAPLPLGPLRQQAFRQAWRPFSSGLGPGGAATPGGAGSTAATPTAAAAAAAARPAAAAAGGAATAAAAAHPLPPRPPPLPKIRSADQLSPEELHAALPSMLFTTSNLILSTLVAAAVAAVGLVAMFWLGTNLRQIAGGAPPPSTAAPAGPAPSAQQPSLAEMVAARKAELEREAAALRALPQTREVRARAAEVRRELSLFAGGGSGGGWLDAGAWWRWLTGGGKGAGGGRAAGAQ